MESRDVSIVVAEKTEGAVKNPLNVLKQKIYYTAAIPLHIIVTIIKLPFEALWWIGYTLHTGMFRVMAGRPFLDRPDPDREDNLGHGHGGTLSAS
jgi:hypothetical protein